MRIDPAAARQIEAAFDAAQARTRAPLACVVAECSADYALVPTLGVAVLALLTPWPLIAFTALAPGRVFLVQLILFALGLGVLAFMPVRARLATRAHRRSACHRGAVVQFSLRGLDHAPERNGALLYVSLAERYARVVADVGLEAPPEAWRGLIEDLCATLRAGDANSALQTAAARMGDLLALQFPAVPGHERPKARRFYVL
jgi:putative membrane protein